jgi:H+-transporting ATPase
MASIENGDAEKQPRPLDVGEDLGEYGNLVKYISNYRDGRRGSTSGASTYDDAPKKKWYQFGKKGALGGDGVFDTPEDWLTTDWKQGLSIHEVESRRKKTGWNELTTEKENLFLKFLGFFTGPILYGTRFHFLASLPLRQLESILVDTHARDFIVPLG